MSLRINHNISAINSHRNLQATDEATAKSLQKLSSGMKINSAADGPASLVISEQMRAQIAGLDQAVDNSELGIALVQTAEGALNEVSNTLISMRQLSIHAANEGVNDEVMLQADQEELVNALELIDRISETTQFGTKKLLNGSQGANGVALGKGLEFVSASVNTKTSPVEGYDVNITTFATRANTTSGEELTQEMIDGGEELAVVQGGKSVRFQTKKGETAKTTVDRLNIQLKQADLNVTAKLDENNNFLSITDNSYGSEASFLVGSSTVGFFSKVADEMILSDSGQDLAGTIHGEQATGEGQFLTGDIGTSVEGLKVHGVYENSDPPPDGDQGVFIGTVTVAQNSLVFQVGANKDQTARVSLRETSSDRLSNDVKNKSEFKSLQSIDVTTTQGAQDSLKLIDESINQISTMRADLGAFQKNTLESNMANLRVASENLTNAESVIRDSDVAKEMATLTRNQIMGNAGTAMLAQANSSSKSVLNLIM